MTVGILTTVEGKSNPVAVFTQTQTRTLFTPKKGMSFRFIRHWIETLRYNSLAAYIPQMINTYQAPRVKALARKLPKLYFKMQNR